MARRYGRSARLLVPEAPLEQSWAGLAGRGWLIATAFETRAAELRAVRQVAAIGLGAGRVFDGHRNALERLLVHRPEDVEASLREQVSTGDLALGVWGADPLPGDDLPAALDGGGRTVTGVKTFCSGAGFLDLALVLVRRAPEGPPILPVLIDLRDPEKVTVDPVWFASPALRESHSHRVVFREAPVLAVLGEEGTLSAEPWISGDALRSTAVWAGGADAVLGRLARNTPRDLAAEERLGRAAAIVGGIDAWLPAALAAVEGAHAGGPAPWPTVASLRLELTERIRELLRIAAEHEGSRGLVTDPVLIEARAGLDVLLLQHRLGPTAQRLGRFVAGEDR